ncbi:MAG: family N-acetyltransferase [Sphingobacteriales bacterium]|nr:family N-acetyltransferase [Sphingobacteriales bacterium]
MQLPIFTLQRTNSTNPDFKQLIIELDRDLWSRYQDGQAEYDQHNKLDYIETVVIAYQEEEAVGAACFKRFDDQTVEIKRLYVKPNKRGQGIAYAILTELEDWAKELKMLATILETGTKQNEAINLYKKAGYHITEKYEPYVNLDLSICMKKNL